MSIQFSCTECDNTLEVPDGSEGQLAKCPSCSAIQEVPAIKSNHSDSWDKDQPEEPINPYASQSNTPGSSSLDPTGELSVQPIDIGWTFKASWELFKVQFGPLIGIFLIMMAVSSLVAGLFFILRLVLLAINGFNPPADPFSTQEIAFELVNNLTTQLVNLWIGIASIRMLLQIARNQPVDFGLFLQSTPFMLRSFLATMLFGLMTLAGLILFIVPGFYVMLTYWNYNYFIVDRNCGVMESFRLAGKHAAGNRLSVLVLALIFFGLGVLGMMAFCIGWIVTTPLSMLMMVIAYLTMTGQPFVQPRINTTP